MYKINSTPTNIHQIREKINRLSGWKSTTKSSITFFIIWLITIYILIGTYPYLIILTTLGTMVFPIQNLVLRIYNSFRIPKIKGKLILQNDIVYHKWTSTWYDQKGRIKKRYYVSTINTKATSITDPQTYNLINIGDHVITAYATKGTKISIVIAYPLYKGIKLRIRPYESENQENYFNLIESSINQNQTWDTEKSIPFNIKCPECNKPIKYKTGVCPFCGAYTPPDEIAKLYPIENSYIEDIDIYSFEEQ